MADIDGWQELAKRIQRIEEIEAIKRVKYRYFRYFDTANVDAIADVFTEDVVITVLGGVSHPYVDGGHPADICFLTAAPHPSSGGFRNTI